MKITSSAPLRISLFGGGTDVGYFNNKYGGICLSLAINLRQYIEIETVEDPKKAVWSIPDRANPNFYKAFFDRLYNLKAYSDCKIESGLGSSASAAVALIGATNKIKGIEFDRGQIAEEAWDIEVNKLGLFGGKQDQYAAAFGGANLFSFGKMVTKTTPISKESIEKIYPYMMLFYLGHRVSPKIQEGLRRPSAKQIHKLTQIRKIAWEAYEPIINGDIERISYLLSKSWHLKKESNSGVSNDFIDQIYEQGISQGALAGKLLGAGSGGHFLFLVNPKDQKQFAKTAKIWGIRHVKFKVDYDGLIIK